MLLVRVGTYRKPQAKENKMSIEIKGQNFTVKGEFKNGNFHLEGPRGGNVLFAKPTEAGYMFYKATGGTALKDGNGLIITATREQLAA